MSLQDRIFYLRLLLEDPAVLAVPADTWTRVDIPYTLQNKKLMGYNNANIFYNGDKDSNVRFNVGLDVTPDVDCNVLFRLVRNLDPTDGVSTGVLSLTAGENWQRVYKFNRPVDGAYYDENDDPVRDQLTLFVRTDTVGGVNLTFNQARIACKGINGSLETVNRTIDRDLLGGEGSRWAHYDPSTGERFVADLIQNKTGNPTVAGVKRKRLKDDNSGTYEDVVILEDGVANNQYVWAVRKGTYEHNDTVEAEVINEEV